MFLFYIMAVHHNKKILCIDSMFFGDCVKNFKFLGENHNPHKKKL